MHRVVVKPLTMRLGRSHSVQKSLLEARVHFTSYPPTRLVRSALVAHLCELAGEKTFLDSKLNQMRKCPICTKESQRICVWGEKTRAFGLGRNVPTPREGRDQPSVPLLWLWRACPTRRDATVDSRGINRG